MEWLVTAIFFVFETGRKVLPSLKPMNPKILQKRYYEDHRKIVKEYGDKIGQASDPDAVLSAVIPRLLTLANRYAFRSNLAWGRGIEQRYKSAWFNVLAAELYQLAGNHYTAGGYFHFAAHTFRELDEYEPAGRYYRQSALCFNDAGKTELAVRACKRGIAAYHQVQESAEADGLNNLLSEWQAAKRVLPLAAFTQMTLALRKQARRWTERG